MKVDDLYFYQDDFKENPRESELSKKVIRSWLNDRVHYAVEDMADPRCLRIVAERLLVRRIIGIDRLDAEYADRVADVAVFAPHGLTFKELVMPQVFVAMAFVPLAPDGKGGSPCLARLYCVGGLKGRHQIPLEGVNEPPLQGYSWFLMGLPSDKQAKDVTGRSWLLAAHLLARVVSNRDVRTAQNLVRYYIVTGDVQQGAICPVKMLRKPELAQQFPNFKWIIPKENNMNMPKWKIEKPKSLDEAYQVIESMRNMATRSLFRFLRKGDVAGVEEQYRIGGNLFAREKGTDLTCLEVVREERGKLWAAKRDEAEFPIGRYKQELRDKLASFEKVTNWLRAQKVDCAMMFYLLATNADENGIKRNSRDCPINAVDELGRTAVDWALINDDVSAAKLLHKYGGTPNPRWRANERLKNAIENFCCQSMYKPEEEKLIVDAIDCGVSPRTHVVLRNTSDPYDTEGATTTLFAAAVAYANFDILQACLRNGADANEKLEATRKIGINASSGEDYEDEIVWQGRPGEMLSKRENWDKFKQLLMDYGAKIV